MSAGPLFDYGHRQQVARARCTDPETSHRAAAKMRAGTVRARILDALRLHGPLTTNELEARTGIKLVSISPRMTGLEEDLLVERAGERNGSITWRATT